MSKFAQLLNELAWVPKPFLSDLEWAVAKAMVNNPSLQDSLPTIGHRLDDLEITQHRLDRDKVARLANDGITDGGLCFTRSGKKYVWDGHHRYFAAQSLGRPVCQMKTFELTDQNTLDGEAREGMSVEMFAAQLRCRVGTLLRAMDSNDRRVYEERKEVGKFDELKKGMETSVEEAYTLKDVQDSIRDVDYHFLFSGSTKLANIYAEAKKLDPKMAEEVKKAEKLLDQARAILRPIKSGV